MLLNPRKRISDYNVVGLFRKVYVTAATIDKGATGFSCTKLSQNS